MVGGAPLGIVEVVLGGGGGAVVVVVRGVAPGISKTSDCVTSDVDGLDGAVTVTVRVTGTPWGGVSGPKPAMV